MFLDVFHQQVSHDTKLERAMGFEPTTASLEGWNSTTELRPHYPYNRLILIDQKHLSLKTGKIQNSLCLVIYSIFNLLDMVGRQGFEPWKPMAADLQSAPVDHLGTCPFDQLGPFLTQTVFELHHGN